MKTSDFSFELPEELIAQYPLETRSASRLLCLQRETGQQPGKIDHRRFADLPSLLCKGDLLVFNNTKVMPARLWGKKASGGKLECLVERVLQGNRVLAHLRSSKSPRQGATLLFASDRGQSFEAQLLCRQGELFELQFPADPCSLLEKYGHMPLPPYMQREDEDSDQQRYQTVYASNTGAVAAPTAGLHFDEAILAELDNMGVGRVELTLHVGAGTFQPVRVENVYEHRMHSEYMELDQACCDRILETRAAGGRVVAVGTTSVRSLESAARSGKLQPFKGETNIFIYPGFEFRVVDAMITNFHLPESTLLMLVSAFAGKENALHAYQEAVAEKYRFYSYGDAMFIS